MDAQSSPAGWTAGWWRVKIRGEAVRGDLVVGCCYRPSDQGKEVDGAFFEQLKEVCIQRFWFSWGTLTSLNIFYMVSKAGDKQATRFLVGLGDNFFI